MIIYTYDHKCELRPESDKIDLQVDYDITGFIYEIRAWSYEFQDWMPVQMRWLELHHSEKLQKIQDRVNAEIKDPDFQSSVKYGT